MNLLIYHFNNGESIIELKKETKNKEKTKSLLF